MKHFSKLICSLFLFSTLSVHEQKENVVFPYSHDSLIELIKDTNWLNASAEKYLQYINSHSIPAILMYKVSAFAILNENEEGLKLMSTALLRIEKSEVNYQGIKSMSSIYYGYFYYTLHPEKNSYYNAVQEAFAKCDPSLSDMKEMYHEQVWPDTSELALNSLINPANQSDETIASELYRILPTLKNLNRPEKF